MLLQQAQKTLLNLSAFYTSGGQDLHALHSALAQAESLAIGLRTVYEAAYDGHLHIEEVRYGHGTDQQYRVTAAAASVFPFQRSQCKPL